MHKFTAFLKEKKWGLPVWAWVLVVAGIIFGLYYIRKRNANTSQSSNQTPLDSGDAAANEAVPAASESGGGGGLGVPSSASVPDQTDGNFLPFVTGTGADIPFTIPPQESETTSPTKPSGVSSAVMKIAQTPVSAKNPNFAAAAQARTTAGKTAGVAVPFGGVTSVRTLKNGASLTTYASGRQVEQAKGKSAYVVKRGG